MENNKKRILEANETGYGLLIERDAGFINNEINNNKFIKENFEIKEGEPSNIFINCVLQKWGVKNKNGRIYPKEVLLAQVQEYMNMVNNRSAISEADHPDQSHISLLNVSHLLTKMWWGTGDKQNILYGTLQIIVSPGYLKYGIVSVVGDKILLYLQNDIKLGISSRGVGSLKDVNGENIVQDDFELIGFDLVATPSTPGAFLFPGTDESKIMSVSENDSDYIENKSGLYLKENKISSAFDTFLL